MSFSIDRDIISDGKVVLKVYDMPMGKDIKYNLKIYISNEGPLANAPIYSAYTSDIKNGIVEFSFSREDLLTPKNYPSNKFKYQVCYLLNDAHYVPNSFKKPETDNWHNITFI